MFSHVSVILFTGGWYPSMPCSRSPGPHLSGKLSLAWGGVSRPTPGGVSRPTPRGVSRPTPRGVVSRPTPRGVYPSMHWGRNSPPPQQLLLWAVCILLECILVIVFNLVYVCWNHRFHYKYPAAAFAAFSLVWSWRDPFGMSFRSPPHYL